jgi:hypothetical protein
LGTVKLSSCAFQQLAAGGLADLPLTIAVLQVQAACRTERRVVPHERGDDRQRFWVMTRDLLAVTGPSLAISLASVRTEPAKHQVPCRPTFSCVALRGTFLRRFCAALSTKTAAHSPERSILRAPGCLPDAAFVLYSDLSWIGATCRRRSSSRRSSVTRIVKPSTVALPSLKPPLRAGGLFGFGCPRSNLRSLTRR